VKTATVIKQFDTFLYSERGKAHWC